MSQPSLANAKPEKRRTDVYTVMLILSFCAIVTACVLLGLEMGRFEGNPPWNTSAAQPVLKQ